MKQFMDEDFILSTDTAKKLFHDYAEKAPVLDYHCHLEPKEIAEDRKFKNITELWLTAKSNRKSDVSLVPFGIAEIF